jgi:hypothetical protein
MRFPKGVRKVVEEYADRIERKTGVQVLWDKPYGCGSFGCVFPLDDINDRRVLKISADPTEGPVVAAIMKTGLDKRLAGLARWFGVWRIPTPIQEGPRGTGWVILRENVYPFDREGIEFERIPPWLKDLGGYNLNRHKAIRLGLYDPEIGPQLNARTKNRAEQYDEEAQGHLGQLYNYEETYYVAEAIEELARNDIVLADVHHGNLGFRKYDWDDEESQGTGTVFWYDKKDRQSLLIFDPGHSSAPKGIPIEELWEEAVRTNPWIEDGAEEIPKI